MYIRLMQVQTNFPIRLKDDYTGFPHIYVLPCIFWNNIHLLRDISFNATQGYTNSISKVPSFPDFTKEKLNLLFIKNM